MTSPVRPPVLYDLAPDYIDPSRGCFNFGGGSGSGGGGTQTTTTNNTPWDNQKPFLQFGFDEAKGQYQADTPQFFPNATYVTPSPQTEAALNMQEARATQGSALNQAAQNQIMSTLGGSYMPTQGGNALSGYTTVSPPNPGGGGAAIPGTGGILNNPSIGGPSTGLPAPMQTGPGGTMTGGPNLGPSNYGPTAGQSMPAQGANVSGGNPAYDAMVQKALRPMVDQFTQTVMPAIGNRFTAAGRNNSGIAETAATKAAADTFMRGVGDTTAALAYPSYEAERGRQFQAASLAPQLAMTDYADIAQLGQVGALREGIAGQQLQDQMARWNFEQNLPDTKLRQYMTLVGGGQYGGSGVTTSPITGANPWLAGAGLLGTAAGAAGSLFGQNSGVFPGALKNLF